MSELESFEASFDTDTKVYQVFAVLRDQQWHCRGCEYTHVGTTQIAGGAGIQGLQRGTKSRPGMIIDSGDHYCAECDAMTRQDRWTGNFAEAVPTGSMSREFARRVVNLLGSRDVVEMTERTANQLTVDHKLPGVRWSPTESEAQTDYNAMTDDDIRARFQLLKQSNGSVSHNLLKSRACERCFRDGKRGTPFGIVSSTSAGGNGNPLTRKTRADASVAVGTTSLNGETI